MQQHGPGQGARVIAETCRRFDQGSSHARSAVLGYALRCSQMLSLCCRRPCSICGCIDSSSQEMTVTTAWPLAGKRSELEVWRVLGVFGHAGVHGGVGLDAAVQNLRRRQVSAREKRGPAQHRSGGLARALTSATPAARSLAAPATDLARPCWHSTCSGRSEQARMRSGCEGRTTAGRDTSMAAPSRGSHSAALLHERERECQRLSASRERRAAPQGQVRDAAPGQLRGRQLLRLAQVNHARPRRRGAGQQLLELFQGSNQQHGSWATCQSQPRVGARAAVSGAPARR